MPKVLEIPGWHLNTNERVVSAIMRRCDKIGGECPCSHEEWDENTTAEDKQCPCKTYRDGKGCHCGLYMEDL